MFLFIFESIGTQELLLIGIVALIFLGPRRMPEMARKLGKILSDFRNTTNEFKATWEREVNFEEEARAMRTGELPHDEKPIARVNSIQPEDVHKEVDLPEIRAVDPAEFQNRTAETKSIESPQVPDTKQVDDLNAKQNWL